MLLAGLFESGDIGRCDREASSEISRGGSAESLDSRVVMVASVESGVPELVEATGSDTGSGRIAVLHILH